MSLHKSQGRFFTSIQGLLFLVLVSCHSGIEIERTQILMGSSPVTIKIKTNLARKKQAFLASQKAFDQANYLEKKLSRYQKNSEISCLNQGKDCSLSPETLKIILMSLELRKKTQNVFDPFYQNKNFKGEPLLSSNKKDSYFLSPRGIQIDLGGIAKGSIVDALSLSLENQGFDRYLINGAGDLRIGNGNWPIFIQNPEQQLPDFSLGKLSNRAIATSGSYEKSGHIYDTKNKQRVRRNQSVTVIAKNLELADALATAAFILGPKDSDLLLKEFPNIKIIWTEKAK